MSPRTGRPPINNPKNNRVTVRLDAELMRLLSDYCIKNGVDKAEAIREGIKRLNEE